MTADKYCVRYSTQAKKDLKAIFSYIAYSLEARQTADRQAGRIRGAVRALDFLPERHPVVDWEPWRSRMIRRLSVNNYVVYTVSSQNKASSKSCVSFTAEETSKT